MICVFINILLPVRRKSSKLFHRRRNEKSFENHWNRSMDYWRL